MGYYKKRPKSKPGKRRRPRNKSSKKERESFVNNRSTTNKYKVKPGETLSSIAKKLNVPPAEIKDLNPNIQEPQVGSKIRIPNR